jgi:DNA-directed RNA polymerase specialized sigma24 family protein
MIEEFYFKEKPLEEIASEAGIAYGTAKSRKHNAIRFCQELRAK